MDNDDLEGGNDLIGDLVKIFGALLEDNDDLEDDNNLEDRRFGQNCRSFA